MFTSVTLWLKKGLGVQEEGLCYTMASMYHDNRVPVRVIQVDTIGGWNNLHIVSGLWSESCHSGDSHMETSETASQDNFKKALSYPMEGCGKDEYQH